MWMRLQIKHPRTVAPLAGAWIEIALDPITDQYVFVAPLAGAWIEIKAYPYVLFNLLVAPLAGAWIEIHISGNN